MANTAIMITMKNLSTVLVICLVFITSHADQTVIESFTGTFRGDVEVSENKACSTEVRLPQIWHNLWVLLSPTIPNYPEPPQSSGMLLVGHFCYLLKNYRNPA